jgi:hypothetical protein
MIRDPVPRDGEDAAARQRRSRKFRLPALLIGRMIARSGSDRESMP